MPIEISEDGHVTVTPDVGEHVIHESMMFVVPVDEERVARAPESDTS